MKDKILKFKIFFKYLIPFIIIGLLYFIIKKLVSSELKGMKVLNGLSKKYLKNINTSKERIEKRKQVYEYVNKNNIKLKQKINKMSDSDLDLFIRNSLKR